MLILIASLFTKQPTQYRIFFKLKYIYFNNVVDAILPLTFFLDTHLFFSITSPIQKHSVHVIPNSNFAISNILKGSTGNYIDNSNQDVIIPVRKY